MNKWTLTVGLLLVLVIVILTWSNRGELEGREVCFDEGECFNVEVADSARERARGLMWRTEMGEGEGMLFIFDEEGRHGFWMKNTFIPLDIIWIDAEGKVVFILEDARPCGDRECEAFDPLVESKYVLEINGGLAGKLGIGVGDKLEF